MTDTLIDRLQRNAVLVCLGLAVAAVLLTRDPWSAAAVVGGGLLVGTSFLSIRGGIEGMARPGLSLVKLAGRYALLGFLAYVMIARLRLPPLGLLAGASSVAVAAAVEAVGLFRTKH